jgi:hypothetical protein
VSTTVNSELETLKIKYDAVVKERDELRALIIIQQKNYEAAVAQLAETKNPTGWACQKCGSEELYSIKTCQHIERLEALLLGIIDVWKAKQWNGANKYWSSLGSVIAKANQALEREK